MMAPYHKPLTCMSYRQLQAADDLRRSIIPHTHACFARNAINEITNSRSQIISTGCDAVRMNTTRGKTGRQNPLGMTRLHIPKELNVKNSGSLGMRYNWKESTFSITPQYSTPRRNKNAFKSIPVSDPQERGLYHFLCGVENRNL
jgi:hypothetical protein